MPLIIEEVSSAIDEDFINYCKDYGLDPDNYSVSTEEITFTEKNNYYKDDVDYAFFNLHFLSHVSTVKMQFIDANGAILYCDMGYDDSASDVRTGVIDMAGYVALKVENADESNATAILYKYTLKE